ncbi:MAG: hypothetical protein ASARMPRED_005554 [Alectoria sarmentosa]|nr:MAG: hypothetical protein ASARMPRED_005554 [Alectoria sarmentosa]
MATPTADVMAIASSLKRERFYRDTAQWDLCRATFHPDAAETYINVAWYEGNVEEFLRQSAQMHKGKVNIIHSSFDPVDIRVRGNRAISEAFCLVTSSLTLRAIDYELASHMRLFHRLQKLSDSGEWRILSVESSYVRDRLVTAFPSSDASSPLVMTNEVQAYPKCYRHLALVMLNRGLKPRPNLPHEDSPESVRRISDRNRAFLDSAEVEFV